MESVRKFLHDHNLNLLDSSKVENKRFSLQAK